MSKHSHRGGPAHRPGFRIERWQRRALYLTGIVLLVSGLAWLLARYAMRPVTPFGELVHPLEPWSMKLHGAAAMAALFLVGALLHVHIRRALRSGHNRATGWSMIVLLGWLALSGYGLYYLAGESGRPWWSTLHWLAGVFAAPALVTHVVIGRRSLA